jgi:hypothetical protein
MEHLAEEISVEILAELVASYSPSAMTGSRALASILPSTDESMWQMI